MKRYLAQAVGIQDKVQAVLSKVSQNGDQASDQMVKTPCMSEEQGHRCVCECEWVRVFVCLSRWPCDELVTSPGCNPAFAP